jgi:hypothetical protein
MPPERSLAPHREQQVQHGLVEHFPRADLLLDHVEACLLEIHAYLCKPIDPRGEISNRLRSCRICRCAHGASIAGRRASPYWRRARGRPAFRHTNRRSRYV